MIHPLQSRFRKRTFRLPLIADLPLVTCQARDTEMTLSKHPSPTLVQRIELSNDTTRVIEVWVEPTPDQYLLQPNDKLGLTVGAEEASCFDTLTLNVLDGGIVVWPSWLGRPSATINGQPVEPD